MMPRVEARLDGVARHGLLPPVIVGSAAVVALTVAGVGWFESATYIAYLLVVVGLPGRVVWLRLLGSPPADRTINVSRLEPWVCGFALGIGLEIVAYAVARGVGEPRLFVLGPLAILIGALWDRLRRCNGKLESWAANHCHPRENVAAAWALGGVLVYTIVWSKERLFDSHPLRAIRLVDPDEMFQLSLIGELRHHFPPVYPYMDYGPLTYQWFFHAHAAAVSWGTGLGTELLYRRTEPLTLTLVAVCGAAVVAARLSPSRWIGALAAAILVLVGSFDVTGGAVGEAVAEERFLQPLILMHSPTQTLGYVLAVPVMVLSMEWLKVGVVPRRQWALFILAASALAGTKVTFLPLFVCGFIAAALVALFRGHAKEARLPLGVAAVLGLIILVSAITLYGGDSQSLGFSPLQSTKFYMGALGIQGGGTVGVFLVSFALLAMWLVPAVGIVGALRSVRTRWDPRLWWLAGAGASGYGATMLLGHVGNSQVYFGRAATVPLAIASAWGLTELHRALPRHVLRWSVATAVLAGISLFSVRLLTENWTTSIIEEGEILETPALRLWVNLPVLLVLCIFFWAASMIIRDATSGRRTVPVRLIVVFLLGLGLARPLAFVVGHHAERAVTSPSLTYGEEGRAAALWLSRHSEPTDYIATNVHCGPAAPVAKSCDARHFWMSAISERRFVIEGWAYTPESAEWVGEFWGNPSVLKANDAIFRTPSSRALEAFSGRTGVRWLFVDKRAPVDVTRLSALPNALVRYERGPYLLLEVLDSTD